MIQKISLPTAIIRGNLLFLFILFTPMELPSYVQYFNSLYTNSYVSLCWHIDFTRASCGSINKLPYMEHAAVS